MPRLPACRVSCVVDRRMDDVPGRGARLPTGGILTWRTPAPDGAFDPANKAFVLSGVSSMLFSNQQVVERQL